MIELLETALAAWRLAHMLVSEDGPLAIFSRLRHAAGVRSVVGRDHTGKPVARRVALTPVAEALTCVWCLSVWTAALLSLPGRPIAWLRRILAASAGAALIHEALERKS